MTLSVHLLRDIGIASSNNCQINGFDLSGFDEVGRDVEEVESTTRVWEYKHTVLSDPCTVMYFDFKSTVADAQGAATTLVHV